MTINDTCIKLCQFNKWTDIAGQVECVPSGKNIGQKVANFQMGKIIAPLAFVEREIFFQAEISLSNGGHTKRHSLLQDTEKASVADEPGKAYFAKNLKQRVFEGEAKGSKVKPEGRNLD